ncbi:MAG: hypothetical protein IPH09_01890 [bacterium]|nr:hypothetical protein [bacterium]
MSDDGRPPSLDPVDDAFLAGLAARVRGAGLSAPALLWLASARPLSFLGSQALHVASPLSDLVVPRAGTARLARILERRSHFDRFLDLLEHPRREAAP